MSRRHERGQLVEAVPMLLVGLIWILGTIQIALFMLGAFTTPVGAYGASRVLEATWPLVDTGQARQVAEGWCAVGYAPAHSDVETSMNPFSAWAGVSMEMRPFVSPQPRGSVTVEGEYPPTLGGAP